VADAVGVEMVEALDDVPCAEQLAGMWQECQAGALSDGKRPGKIRCAAAPLVIGEAEPQDTATCVLRGQASERTSIQRVSGAVGRDDDPHADASL